MERQSSASFAGNYLAVVSLRAIFAKQSPDIERGDCFVGKKRLLAMTG
jgi:hypothetical protein